MREERKTELGPARAENNVAQLATQTFPLVICLLAGLITPFPKVDEHQ